MTLLRPMPASGTYELVGGARYQVEGFPPFVVPAGFCTDGASIPRYFWRLIGTPFDPELIEAALGHDWLYQHSRSIVWTREHADALLLSAMLTHGVNPLRARVIWLAVRCFGWIFWYRCRRRA